MAIYLVQAPDGKTLRIEGPEGASESEVFAQAQKLYTPDTAAPTQGKSLAPPAAAVNSGLDGGSASKTVYDFVPPVADVFGINKPAQTPTPSAVESVFGKAPSVDAIPAGVAPDFIDGVRQDLLRATPATRMEMMGGGDMRAKVAKNLLLSNPNDFLPRQQASMRETPLPTQIGMDLNTAIENPALKGVVKGFAGLGQVIPGMVEAGADLVGADGVARFAADVGDTARQVGAPLRGKAGNEQLVTSVFNSITQSSPTLVAGMMGGPAMRMLFAQASAQEYSEGRAAGLRGDDAAMRAGIMAGAEVLGERIGFSDQIKILKGVIGKLPVDEIAPAFARELVKNQLGEQLTTGIQFAADKVGPGALNPQATLEQYLNQAGETAKVALGQSLVMGGAPAAIQGARSTAAAQTEDQLANDPAFQLARELSRSVQNTEINQDATRQAAVNALSPDNAQMEVAPTARDTSKPEPVPATPAPQPIEPAAQQPLAAAQPTGQAEPKQPNQNRVVTVTGREIETRLRVVDASQLQAASGDLQPRDRSRQSSDMQVNDIASKLDPQRLGASAEADRGAPIVGDDGVIESGNGRVQAIQRAYAMFPERGQAYRNYIQGLGFDVTGMEQPVLVRERVTPLSPEDRRAFVQEANQSSIMSMSATEQAAMDVAALTDNVVGNYVGGSVESIANRPFVSSFINNLPQAQQNSLVMSDGSLSADGIVRVRRALLAGAYENKDLLEKLLESTDNDIKSIGGALFDTAPLWIQMRRKVATGNIAGNFDVTKQLVQAVQIVEQYRSTGRKIKEFLDQNDLLGERDLVVDNLVRAFYNPTLTRAAGRDIEAANNQDTGDIFGDAPQPGDLMAGAVQQTNESNDGQLFQSTDPNGAEQGVSQDLAATQPAAPGRDGQKPRGRGAQDPLQDRQNRGRTQGQDGQGTTDQAQQGDVNERAARLDAPNASTAQGDGGGVREDNADTQEPNKSQRIRGTSADSLFNEVSFTNRQSIYRDAFVELGYDPADAELLPPQNQLRILSEGLKNTYGLPEIHVSSKANIREAIDQLLDAYRGLQLMTAVLDLPTSAIGLNNTLALAMTRQGQFLGAYFPAGSNGSMLEGIVTNGPTIGMPGRSNSFAHEWGHALDYYLLSNYEGGIQDLSGYVRKGESFSDKTPESIQDSFKLLMNSIFFDKAEQSAKIMELERKIEAGKAKGKDVSALEKTLAETLAGSSKSRKDKSQFYNDAGDFAAAIGGDADYWRAPTEMLARSFEAYIAHKVEAAGGSTEFIGKGDDAYMSDADLRLAKTFPKDSDRYNIFRAYDLLFDAIRAEALLNPEGKPVANMPGNVRLSDPAKYYDDQIESAQSPLLKRAWEQEKRAWQVRARQLEKESKRPGDGKTLLERSEDLTRSFLETNRGVLLSVEGRYKRRGNAAAAQAVREIIKRVATDPGSGNETFKGGVYAEAVEREARRRMTRLGNIAKSFGADLLSDAQLAQLAQLLTNTTDTPNVTDKQVLGLAGPLREFLTDMYYYNRDAGLDIGFVKDQGYLPRMIDEPLVSAAGQEFIEDATRVYQIVFERDTVRPDEADGLEQGIAAIDKRAREAGLDKSTPALAAYVEAKKEFARLKKKLDAANLSEDSDTIEAAMAELAEFTENAMDVFNDAYDVVRDAWSQNAAIEYQTRISYGSPSSFSSQSPAGSYLKSRTLPKEADEILAKYYIQDPLERITTYVSQSVRKSEYNRRFGKDVRTKAKTERLYQIEQDMIGSGVSKEDREMVMKVVGQVTGTDNSTMPSGALRLTGYVHSLGQIALLGRVLLTSLAEPIAVALQTGRTADGLKAVMLTAQEIIATGSVRERRAMAHVLGIVGSDMTDEIISNRLGGTFAETARMSKVTANFFRRVGLTGLTNAQRRAAMSLSGRYVLEMANTAIDAAATKEQRGFAVDELVDAGLTRRQVEEFGKWAQEYSQRIPRHDELIGEGGELTEMGKLYAVMVGRLVNQSIQAPTAIDRPYAANTPIGRMTYGLLSFTMAFFRNMAVKGFKKIERELDARGTKQATKVAAMQVVAPMAALYAGHFIVTAVREALLNPDKWEDESKKANGIPMRYLALLAFSRAGFTGLADPLYNAVLGVKYQRDLANLLTGASASFFLQSIERIVKYIVANSENTNSAERAAARGLYELSLQPGLAYLTGALPGGPVVGYGLGASYAYMSSPAFKSQWQDWMAGEKDSKAKRGGSKQEKSTTF
jgi:hypothetical protein